MKKIEVVIEGTAPLLMHSAEKMEEQRITGNPGKVYDKKKEAEKVAYRNDKGELYVPSRALKACILNAASWFKIGKISAKQLIAGCSKLEPHELTLTDTKGKKLTQYKVDIRPVVVQRSRIMRSRPRIDEWKMKFEIIYNEKLLSDTTKLNQIIEEAGQRIGLLDNRPQKYGENGTFKIIKFLPK